MNNTALTQMEQPFQQQCQMIAEFNVMHRRQILDYSKAFLDKVFPLDRGSHQDVQSYVMYYQHLLVFFADGSQTGLQNPAQLVAFGGAEEKPQSLLLCDHGRHVELLFCRASSDDKAGISDILLQLSDGQWFSMLRGNTAPAACVSPAQYSPCFRDLQGGFYQPQ
ncbi:malate synthase [Rheinheimera marina]|uniref:Malate synthase n=1 Tax=Rheinheimera marina TaxID=1774958 RepID=A0ABV9JPE5_9GAMM